jgi:hypothetical protein
VHFERKGAPDVPPDGAEGIKRREDVVLEESTRRPVLVVEEEAWWYVRSAKG